MPKKKDVSIMSMENNLDRENLDFLQKVFDYVRNRFPWVCVPVAQFIACLAALESNFGKSNIAFENHNYVGMKVPRVRLSTCIGENRGHAVYLSWTSSICDFMFWCQYYGFNQKDFKTFASFVRKFRRTAYNPSQFYVSQIINLKDQYYGPNQTK